MVDDSVQLVHRQDLDVPVIMRFGGSAPDSVHRDMVDIPARDRDRYSTLSSGSDDGPF